MVEVVFGHYVERLPFTCPYKVSGELPQPGTPGGGRSPDFDVERVNTGLYAQVRAARALVPCDAKAIQIFIVPDIPGKSYSVSAIYVFDKPVKELQKWLACVEQIFYLLLLQTTF